MGGCFLDSNIAYLVAGLKKKYVELMEIDNYKVRSI